MAKIYCNHGDSSIPAFQCTRADAVDVCPICAERHVESGHFFRVEDMESIGSDRVGVAHGVNMGLPGSFYDIGGGRKGYRPAYASSDANSVWKAREIAKAHGLTPLDQGRFRSVGARRR